MVIDSVALSAKISREVQQRIIPQLYTLFSGEKTPVASMVNMGEGVAHLIKVFLLLHLFHFPSLHLTLSPPPSLFLHPFVTLKFVASPASFSWYCRSVKQLRETRLGELSAVQR